MFGHRYSDYFINTAKLRTEETIQGWFQRRCYRSMLLFCVVLHIMAAVIMLRSRKASRTATRPSKLSQSTSSRPHATPTPTAPTPVLIQVVMNSSRTVSSDWNIPMIYVVTPTYKRPEQQAELTRLAQTLMHVPALHWIIVEDSFQPTAHVQRVLRRSRLNYTHMLGPKPKRPSESPKYRNSNEPLPEPRGVSNRNAALRWLRENVNSGVMYFADDDNTYDLQLFEEMRWTKKVSVWPVGLVGYLGISSPIVRNGRVTRFYDSWVGNRKFAVDMAGFATNIAFMHQHQNVTMPYSVALEEEGFLSCLNLTLDDLEPRANNCTEVLVWHTTSKHYEYPKPLTSEELDYFEENNLYTLLENFL